MNRPVSSTKPLSWRTLWHKTPWLKWLAASIWIVLISGIAFLWQLGHIGLVDETEPLFAEAARQMTVTGDWVTPYFNGETRFDKPPFIYWLMAIAYQIVGVNEWAARLPSALAAIALTAFCFYVLRQFGWSKGSVPHLNLDPPVLQVSGAASRTLAGLNDPRWTTAWIGSGAIALNLQTILWGRSGVSDMLLTACMGSALLAFFCGYAQPHTPQRQRRWYLGFYILAALAVLTKGPVGIVVPGMIIVAFLLYVGQLWPVLREMQILWGSVIFLLMTVPWYVLVIQAHGQTYIESFFGYHNVERFTSVVNNHSAPWYFYVLVVLLGFIPWSIYLPLAIARLQIWQRSQWQHVPRHGHLGPFALIWFLVIFVFFSIAVTKLPSYTLPLLPSTSVLVALLWSEKMTGASAERERVGSQAITLGPQRARLSDSAGMLISHLTNILFLVILSGAVLYSSNWLGDDPVMPELPQLMQESNILLVGSVSWSLGAIMSSVLLMKRRSHWIWVTNLIAFIAFLLLTLLPALPLMDSQRQLPLRQISAHIVRTSDETAEIIMVGFKKPTLVFYTQRPVTYIYGVDEAIAYLRTQGKLRNSFAPRNARSYDAFIVGQASELNDIPLSTQKYESVQDAGVYRLLRLHLARSRTQ